MTVIQTLKDIITIATTLVETVDRLKKREEKVPTSSEHAQKTETPQKTDL